MILSLLDSDNSRIQILFNAFLKRVQIYILISDMAKHFFKKSISQIFAALS